MTARTCSFPNTPKQEGWVLIIGMVVLVMLTIIAMGVMRTTIQEEKMAGISRDMNISFESAEIGLREAEAFIEKPSSQGLFNETKNGIYAQGAADEHLEPAPFRTKWDDNNSITVSTGAQNTSRYMIKKLTEIGDGGSLNMGGYGETDLTQKTVIYRITARGGGGNDNTQTILRSHYAKSD